MTGRTERPPRQSNSPSATGRTAGPLRQSNSPSATGRTGGPLRQVDPLLLAGLPVALAAVLGGLVASGWSPLQTGDVAVSRAAERLDRAAPVLVPVARALTHLGDPALMWLLSLAAVALLARRRPRVAVVVLVARCAAQLLSSGIKALVVRARPEFAVPLASAHGSSFPSGHALGAAALYGTAAVLVGALARGRGRWTAPAARLVLVGVPVLVGATRVLLGVHFLSDVVAGLLLGGAVALAAGVLAGGRATAGGRGTVAGRRRTARCRTAQVVQGVEG